MNDNHASCTWRVHHNINNFQMDHQELHKPFHGDNIKIPDSFQEYDGPCNNMSNLESSQPCTIQEPSLDHNESDIPDIVLEDITTPEITVVPDLAHEIQAKLYPGATLSLIQGVSLLLSWFSAFPGMGKTSFSHLLVILHHFLLPLGNSLPTSYDAAIKILNPFLSPITEYHCCINDCIVYRNSTAGEYESLVVCPLCKEPRFYPDGKTP